MLKLFSLFLLLFFDVGFWQQLSPNFVPNNFFVAAVRRPRKTVSAPIDFQFTAPQYNLSIYENANVGTIAVSDQSQLRQRHKLFAINQTPLQTPTGAYLSNNVLSDGAEKIGVFLPKGYHQVSFKIVEGDKQQRFSASAKKLGNFAFLIIEYQHDDILNREMQSEYQLLVRVTAKRKKSNALEASTVVNLRILDENDNSPMFRQMQYTVESDDRTLLNSRLVRLDGFDADEGLNGELWFSQLTPSDQFYVESETGWIRNYAALRPGNYTLEFRIEDRASRLFYYEKDRNGGSAFSLIRNRATVHFNVLPKRTNLTAKPKLYFQPVSFEPFQRGKQLAAILKVEDTITDPSFLDLRILNQLNQFQQIKRKSNSEFYLFLINSTGLSVSVTIGVFESFIYPYTVHNVQIHKENFTLFPNFTNRKVWFDFNNSRGIIKSKLNQNEIKIFVNESTTVGSVIEKFSAKTTFLEDQPRIWFKLETTSQETVLKPNFKQSKSSKNGFIVAPFDLNYRKGQLRLKSKLDFDSKLQQKVFTFKLIIGLDVDANVNSQKVHTIKAQTHLIIELADSNDNCPEFLQKSIPKGFKLKILNEMPKISLDAIIYRPEIRDIDSGQNAEIVFKLIGVLGSEQYFDIDARSGEVKIVKNLPESNNIWRIRILAMDLGWPISHYAQLTFDILRKNSSSMPFSPFALNLVNNKGEAIEEVGIKDTCNLPNNYSPTFAKEQPKVFYVNENAAIRKVIGKIVATDKDFGYNGIIHYFLEDLYFNIDTITGNLFVNNNLTPLVQQQKIFANNSAEHIEYHLEIFAQDLALVEPKTTSLKIIVQIKGHNCHNPVFEMPSYNIKIAEDTETGSELLQLRAYDFDIGRNGRVEYKIAVDTKNIVSINPETGILRLEKVLNREFVFPAPETPGFGLRKFEVFDKFRFLVMALDGGTPTKIGFANVTIHLIDVNNNSPYCFKKTHTASLMEDSPNGHLITCLGAGDFDSGENGELSFEIDNSLSSINKAILPFRIDKSSGCIFVQSEKFLDYEKISSYNFSVKVSDKGRPHSLSTNCDVEISLIDVNENILPPYFADVALEASIEENLPAKTEVIKVQAIDPQGGLVMYRLISGSGLGLFEIDAVSGVIRSTVQLDYEESSYYWLTVCAISGAEQSQLASHLHVLVRILNKNDRAPVFKHPIYFASILENSPENKVVIKVEAIDPDYNKANDRGMVTNNFGGVKYSIIKGNPQSNFAIDENTGYIVSGKRRLDREILAEHELYVRACDFGIPQLCTVAVVVVTVEDVNDCAPEFESSKITVNVPADQPPESFLCRIFAIDADSDGPNSILNYRLSSGSQSTKDDSFTIDNFGRIYAQEPLKAGTQVQLKVFAQDEGTPSFVTNTTVTLVALGRANKFTVSNRKPRLIDSNLWRDLYISDSDAVGVIVGIVKAVDDDNDPLWWFISDANGSNLNNTFTFRGNNGELVLARPVNAIDLSLNEIKLIISVSDGIDQVQDEIKIRISRSIALRPKFTVSFAVVELNVESPVGFVAYSAHAEFDKTRAGISHPHRILYAIHSIDDIAALEVFQMDQNSGNLIVEQVSALKKLSQNFSVVVSAKIFGKENFARIEFRLKSTNEHTPAFIFDQYEFLILPKENEANNDDDKRYVGFVEAYDSDPREYGVVSYAIISGNELGNFMLNSTTGELFLTPKFNSKTFSSEVVLTVRAADLAPIPKSSTCTVRIYDTEWLNQMESDLQKLQLNRYHYDVVIEDTTPVNFDLSLIEPKKGSGFLIYHLENTRKNSLSQSCSQFLSIDFAVGRVRFRNAIPKLEAVLLLNCSIVVRQSTIYGGSSAIAHLSIKIIPNSWKHDLRFKSNEYIGSINENALNGSPVLLFQNKGNQQEVLALLTIEASSYGTQHYQIDNVLLKRSLRFNILNLQEPYFFIEKLNSAETSQAILRNTQSNLDFETTKEWHVYIMAQLFDDESVENILPNQLNYAAHPCLVKIIVNDVNDQTPTFVENEGFHQLKMRLPPVYGVQLGKIQAKDDDTVGSLHYAVSRIYESFTENVDITKAKLLSQGLNQLFRVNRYNGAIIVASNDSKLYKAPFYLLKTIVSDGIHTNHTITQIRVQNSAKHTNTSAVNQLQFSRDIYSITVMENQTAENWTNDSLSSLISLWPQNAEFGETFEFCLLNPHKSFVFNLQTGILKLNRSNPLDRELNDKLHLMVQLNRREEGVIKNTQTYALINVDIEDVNDCVPTFSQDLYLATISEEADVGFRVTNVKAKDADLGMSGVVRYSLNNEAPNFFEINKYDGRITIATKPGPEILRLGAELRFFAIATDRGSPISLNSSVEVRVRVANKNQPAFAYSFYATHVPEAAAPGTHVITVRAYSNTNGVVGYQIKNGDPFRHFTIDFTKGTISINNVLDRELFASYNLSVEAFDITRSNVSSALTIVNVYVDNANDSPPRFEQTVYLLNISENCHVSALIGSVRAFDADASSEPLYISNSKEFENASELTSEFLTLNNAKNYLSYSIVEGNRSVVSIDSITGQLFLASKLDYETKSFYEYTITVQDLDRLSSEAILKIFVQDANDCKPEWRGPSPLRRALYTNFTESNPQIVYVFANEIFDADFVSSLPLTDEMRPRFHFEIVEGDTTLFHLEKNSGVLITSRSLDFYELKRIAATSGSVLEPDGNMRRLNISVSDGLFKTFITIEIELVPAESTSSTLHFQQSLYTITISEFRASTNRSAISVVKAIGRNKPLQYAIAGINKSSSNPWPFYIETESGRIFLRERLDREKLPSTGRLSIPLRVDDALRQSAFTRLEINVIDENDNAPIWVAPNDGYSFCFDANAHEGEPIAIVMATDTDTEDRLEYSLLSGSGSNGINPQKFFDIHPTQGYITMKRNYNESNDRSILSQKSFSFFVRVSDSGNPPHQSEIPVNVHFIKDSLLVPHLSQLHYLFAISEDAPVGKLIGQLQANQMTQSFQSVRFLIVSNNQDPLPFFLDKSNGVLKLTKKLDFEKKQQFNFVVQIFVNDRNEDERFHSYSIVTVSIVDVNDNVPVFKTFYENIEIIENTMPSTIVAVFLAYDVDRQSANSRVSYTLESANETDLLIGNDFVIDSEYGWLMIGTGGVDHERREQYFLKIGASDEDGLVTHQIVNVKILDVNDSPPQFDRLTYTSNYEIPESLLSTTNNELRDTLMKPILKFTITDLDRNESNENLKIFISNCNTLNGLNSEPLHNFEIASIFEISDSKSELILKSLPPKQIFKNNLKNSQTICLIASDGLNYGNAKAEITFKVGAKVKTKSFCDTFEDESIVIPANLAKGHTVHVFKKQIYRNAMNQSIIAVNFHLMDFGGAFEISNNSKIVLAENGFYQKPNHTLQVRIFPELLHINFNSDGKHLQTKKANLGSCLQTIYVTIQNANRMAPIFEHKIFSSTVKENMDIIDNQSYFVLRVEARDDDFGDFGKLVYSINEEKFSENQKPSEVGVRNSQLEEIFKSFSLNKDTGVLTLKKALDRELNALFEIPIRVQDGGGLFATAKIVIHVEDINDNAPVFKQPIYRLKVLENEAIEYELLVIQADDYDLNSNITYKIFEEQGQQNNVTKMIEINAQTGVLKLVDHLDFEKIKQISFSVEATDNGNPPLSSKCFIEIEVLDVNDNAPKFEQTLYEANIYENIEIRTKILQVFAYDADSEHFGRVSYKISSSDEINSASYFMITDDGTLILKKLVDYEAVKVLRINVHALDGGSPPLSDDAIVQINILDINDNPPHFATCNMTAVVQEGMKPGQTLLNIALSDADSPINGAPFRLELFGEGAEMFAFDALQNLITKQQISYSKHKQFLLSVKGFDVGNLVSMCVLRIFVKPQSKFPPNVEPLLITLNNLMGEFLGGRIGKVMATDQDPSDMLRYSIIDTSSNIHFKGNRNSQTAPSRFNIDSESGVIIAASDLLPGLYRFNVSVTDGKFNVQAPVRVDVSDIDQDALDHSVSLRLKRLSAERFVRDKMRVFYDLLAREIGVSPTSIRILSIQDQDNNFITNKRFRRADSANSIQQNNTFASSITPIINNNATYVEESDLDVLFTVSRGELMSRGYYRPTFIKQKIENSVNTISDETGLDIVSLTSEVCRRDLCVKGDCRDRLWLDNVALRVIDTGASNAFVSPRHERTFECICRQGFSGRFCDVPVNQCSKELCMRTEICIPSDEESSGFTCVCPPGFRGERCAEPKCEEPSACSQREALSLLGNGFFQLAISTSVESRLELGLTFKTVSHNAVLMHGQKIRDFHEIRIRNGSVEYRWDCGSGEGVARLPNVRVDDGVWHELKISRRGRQTTITLDNVYIAEGTSPPGSDVINLFQQATILTFGALVKSFDDLTLENLSTLNVSTNINQPSTHSLFNSEGFVRHRRHLRYHSWLQNITKNSDEHHLNRRHYHFRNYFQSHGSNHFRYRETAQELQKKIEEGMIGCFGWISIDGYHLSKTEQGLRLQNAAIGCDTSSMGPCLSVPCKNGGQCMPNRTHNSYSCICSDGFTGSNCEIDLNACASNPCPNGVPCHNLYNDFHCSCPTGFTGKTCQLRGDWDPCLTKPCGSYGTCVRNGATFVCNCSNGFSGNFCADRVPKIKTNGSILLDSFEFYVLFVVFVVAILILIIITCRRQNITINSIRCLVQKIANGNHKKNADASETKNGGSKSLAKPADEACNPLVPRLTTTNERPPPPLPPKLSRQAQLYQNLGGGSHPNNISALPTVEVRPIQSVAGSNRILSDACCNSPLLIKQKTRNNSIASGARNSASSNTNSMKSNGNKNQNKPQPPPHQRQFHANNVYNKNLQNLHSPHNGFNRENVNKIPTACCAVGGSKSHQNSPILKAAADGRNHKNIEIESVEKTILSDISAGAAINKASDKIDKNIINNVLTANNDYLTMKPIHRAKPFNAQPICLGNDKCFVESLTNSQKPPTPPAHRPIQKIIDINQKLPNDIITDFSLLYDTPKDTNNENNTVESLSNVSTN